MRVLKLKHDCKRRITQSLKTSGLFLTTVFPLTCLHIANTKLVGQDTFYIKATKRYSITYVYIFMEKHAAETYIYLQKYLVTGQHVLHRLQTILTSNKGSLDKNLRRTHVSIRFSHR